MVCVIANGSMSAPVETDSFPFEIIAPAPPPRNNGNRASLNRIRP